MTPAGFEGFFEGLGAAFATGDPQLIEQTRAELGKRYDLGYLPHWVPELKARYGLMVIGE